MKKLFIFVILVMLFSCKETTINDISNKVDSYLLGMLPTGSKVIKVYDEHSIKIELDDNYFLVYGRRLNYNNAVFTITLMR